VHERPGLRVEDPASIAFVVVRRVLVDGKELGQRHERRALKQSEMAERRPDDCRPAAGVLVRLVKLGQPLVQPRRDRTDRVGNQEMCVFVEDRAA
jgi:hypothetical protein